MADHFDVAFSASGVDISVQNNGAVIVGVTKTGDYKTIAPQVNAYIPSGTLHARYTNRFDEHYGGGAS